MYWHDRYLRDLKTMIYIVSKFWDRGDIESKQGKPLSPNFSSVTRVWRCIPPMVHRIHRSRYDFRQIPTSCMDQGHVWWTSFNLTVQYIMFGYLRMQQRRTRPFGVVLCYHTDLDRTCSTRTIWGDRSLPGSVPHYSWTRGKKSLSWSTSSVQSMALKFNS